MKVKSGTVFSIVKDNMTIPGCTVSKEIIKGKNQVLCFSMAENTDISAEIYPYRKLILVLYGSIIVYDGKGITDTVVEGNIYITPANMMTGVKAEENAVYFEILLNEEDIMNEIIKSGEVFKLADLVPFREDRIVNMDIVHNDKMKFVVMAFDEGTSLSEHAAPGEALIFALEGEAVISYEGKDFNIKAGENFKFAKGGLHAVKAVKPFKMGLLLTLE